ncbi:Pyrroline-5-carboxylate reductase [Meristemomyces frigidus]|nr:Pyrroline-5-carboxylate reductase [Meristemomyces frigidus]
MERDLTPEWILKETLSVQHKALMDYVKEKTGVQRDGGLTLTVLGCGTMGIAILGGILDSLSSSQPSTSDNEPTPQKLPTKFNACVRRPESAKRVKKELGHYQAIQQVTIYENENLKPVQDADVILLGCKPYMVGDILKAEGMQKALAGKLLISICAGVTEEQISQHLSPTSEGESECTVVRAMPNTAAAVRESMTVIGTSNPPLPAETDSLVTWIFTRIGRVVHLPPSNMDACTALCGSGPGFVAVMAESLAAGGIAMGIPREEAYLMAAQTMRGTTGLLLAGEHPAILRDKVSTPGGCTIGGLLVLEEGMVRGTIAKAVREATVVASQLGQGKQA